MKELFLKLNYKIPEANTYVGGLFFIMGTTLLRSSIAKTLSYKECLKCLKKKTTK